MSNEKEKINPFTIEKEMRLFEDVAKLKSTINGNGRPGVFDMINDVKKDVADVKEDIYQVKRDVAEVTTDISKVQIYVSNINSDVGQIKTTLDHFIKNREKTCPSIIEKGKKENKKKCWYNRVEFWIAATTAVIMVGISMTTLILSITDKL